MFARFCPRCLRNCVGRSSKRVFTVLGSIILAMGIFVYVVVPSVIDTIEQQVARNDSFRISHSDGHYDVRTIINGQDGITKSTSSSKISERKLNKVKIDNQMVNQLKFALSKIDRKDWDKCLDNRATLGQFIERGGGRAMSEKTSWQKFYNQFGICDIYRENSETVEKLLKEMAEMPIIEASVKSGGTQIKLKLTFENGQNAIFKPQRFPDLNQETLPNHFYFSDYERSSAEIAGFHLDRLLGFRRAIPTVGRVLDLQHILNISDVDLKRTFFTSPAKNLCFVGTCSYYCDTGHAICGKPYKIRGSLQVYLPSKDYLPRKHVKSLYRRTYSRRNQIADWQASNVDYCNDVVKRNETYSNGRRLLDLIDLHIFDFLLGNQDRHHFDTIDIFDKQVYMLHMDNARGFGRASEDYLDILAPLYQCCVIRPSTLNTLIKFYTDSIPFSDVFRESLSMDPTFPILAEKHISAVDRRLEIILKHVLVCVKNAKNVSDVIRRDYHNRNFIFSNQKNRFKQNH